MSLISPEGRTPETLARQFSRRAKLASALADNAASRGRDEAAFVARKMAEYNNGVSDGIIDRTQATTENETSIHGSKLPLADTPTFRTLYEEDGISSTFLRGPSVDAEEVRSLAQAVLGIQRLMLPLHTDSQVDVVQLLGPDSITPNSLQDIYAYANRDVPRIIQHPLRTRSPLGFYVVQTELDVFALRQ